MVYAVSMSLLILTIVVFFGLARGNYASFGTAQTILRVLVAAPLLISGVLLHFFHARVTAGIIPPVFPARSFLAAFTGVCEIAGAIGLFVPRVRRAAAFWISIMMVAIFPANIYSAGKVIEGFQFPGVPLRLAMQVIYILFVLLAGYGLPRRASRR